jgi:hypothetical protein
MGESSKYMAHQGFLLALLLSTDLTKTVNIREAGNACYVHTHICTIGISFENNKASFKV